MVLPSRTLSTKFMTQMWSLRVNNISLQANENNYESYSESDKTLFQVASDNIHTENFTSISLMGQNLITANDPTTSPKSMSPSIGRNSKGKSILDCWNEFTTPSGDSQASSDLKRMEPYELLKTSVN